MKSRRYFLKKCSLAATGILLSKQFSMHGDKNFVVPFVQGKGDTITLLHTSDLHNCLQPLTHDIYSNLGGFENTAAAISRIKNGTSNVVLLDAGDISSGNKQDQKDHLTTLRIMQSLGYDAALPGNRDYEAGTDYLQQQWKKNNIAILASNYSFRNPGLKNLHQPYKIIQKGSIKIGIIAAGIHLKGLVHDDINDHVRYKDPVKELTAIATMLKEVEKCQMVICLSHLGFKNEKSVDDMKLANLSTNIDVIIGGHSHTFLPAPYIALNQHNQQVIINHAGYGGIVLGNMSVSFDDRGNKNMVNFNNQMIGTKDNKWVRQGSTTCAMS